MPEPTDRFEMLLRSGFGQKAEAFRQSVIEVADTAYICQAWFESRGFAPTAADVIAMTSLVMNRVSVIEHAERGLLEE